MRPGRLPWSEPNATRRPIPGLRRSAAPCAWLVAVIPLLRTFPFDSSVVALVVPLLVDSRRASTRRVAARSFPGRTAGDPVQWPVGHVDAQVAIGRSWPVGTGGTEAPCLHGGRRNTWFRRCSGRGVYSGHLTVCARRRPEKPQVVP